MKDFISVSPLKILERSSARILGPGNLGVLVARAGVGKTACLIHMAFDRVFSGKKLVHISLEEGPEKVASYYRVILHDLAKALEIGDDQDYRELLERNRMILAYLNQSFDLDRLRANLKNLTEQMDFSPGTLIVDGLDFVETGRDLFEGLRGIAGEFQTEIWLSALSHRHITDASERGIPYPVHDLDDLFSVVLQLQPDETGLFLRLLKDGDRYEIPENSIRLDPNTFLALD